MEGGNLQELVKKQAKIIQTQAETIKRQAAEIVDIKTWIAELKTIITHWQKNFGRVEPGSCLPGAPTDPDVPN
jgi:hypothetical protein